MSPTRKSSPAPTAGTEESIVHAIFDLSNHLMRRGERLAARAELTTQQWIVLLQIAGDPNFPGPTVSRSTGVLPSEIAAARGVTRATVSAVVSSLERQGLIRQVPDHEDRRRRRLRLTRAGERAVATTEPLRRSANRRLFSRLGAGERKELLRLLHTCLSSLSEMPSVDE